MSRSLAALAATMMLSCTPAMALDDSDFQEMLATAQNLKRENRYEEARHELEMIIRIGQPGAEAFADQARDELRFGLPLQQARYLIIRLGEPLNVTTERMALLRRAQTLLQQIIEDNADMPERVDVAQQMLDDLHLSAQALTTAHRSNAFAAVSELRFELDKEFTMRDQAPSRAEAAKLLAAALRRARLSPGHFIIKDYWTARDGYYLILRDMEGGGPDIRVRRAEGSSDITRMERSGRD